MKAKITDLQAGLPPGVKIVPFYDRSELIDNSIDTLRHALIEEILLVTLAHIIFLAHFRSILIVTLPLPLAVLSSFLILYYLNVTVEHHVAGRHRHRDRRAGGRGHRRH